MNPARRKTRTLLAVVATGVVIACAPGKSVQPRGDLQRAVAVYIAGDYEEAARRLDAVAREATDDATRREAYTYLGRAHMALGNTDAAIDAFTLGVQHGDHGPCIEYLEVLKRYHEGSPEGLHILETITRGELAGAAVRVLDEAQVDPTGPTPIQMVEKRGWFPALPDGRDHAEEPVTRAALYVFVSRVLADAGIRGGADAVIPGGYRRAVNDPTPVSGSEAIAALERVRALKEKHGR